MTLLNRVKNAEGVRRTGIVNELVKRMQQRLFRSFGHVERKDEYRISRKALMAEV